MKDNKIPSPLVSLLPVFVLILLLFVTIRTFGSDALSGGSQVCLLVATAVCVQLVLLAVLLPLLWELYYCCGLFLCSRGLIFLEL